MNKLLAYFIAIVGLGIALLSFNLSMFNFTLPAFIKPVFITLAGIALIIIGVFFSMSKGKGKHIANEVPIYHKDKIVGYRKVR